MTFNRQLDIFIAIAATLLVFVGCIFWLAMPVRFAVIIAAAVFAIGLLIGRYILEFVNHLLGF